MDDLVERLRTYRPTNEWGDGVHHVICDEAAARIQALETSLAEAEGRVMNALWPILGGNHTDADTWAEIGQAVADALETGEWKK